MATGESRGVSVSIFLPTGEPEGLRIIGNLNVTSEGYIFPSQGFPQVVGSAAALSNPGVYVLWGDVEPDELPSVYVGKSNNLRERLINHKSAKDRVFWYHTFAFTTKDRGLNSAHAGYIESQLISLASDAKRCKLENSQIPPVDELVGITKNDADRFLGDLLLYLQIVGVQFFQKPLDRVDNDEMLYLNRGGASATGYRLSDGSFLVKMGSYASGTEAGLTYPKHSELRKSLKEAGIFEEVNGKYRLTEDHIFSSASAAAGVFAGARVSGNVYWQNAE